MKILFNQKVLNINGQPITMPGTMPDETIEIVLGDLLVSSILQGNVKSDEDAETAYALCKKLNTHVQNNETTPMEVTDIELEFIKDIMSYQPVAIRGFFIELIKNA